MATAAAAGPLDSLDGEAIGVGRVAFTTLLRAPVAVVLTDPDHADAATPVGDALNAVMVARGGNRVTAVDLSSVWRVSRPAARLVLGKVKDDALHKIHTGYTALRRPVPADLVTHRAWLVADWTGAWKPLLAPDCPGLAVAIVTPDHRSPTVLCDPTVDQATAAFEAVLPPPRTGAAPPP